MNEYINQNIHMRSGSCALCIHTWHASYIIIFHVGTEKSFLFINVKAPSADHSEVFVFLGSKQGAPNGSGREASAVFVVRCYIKEFLPNSITFSWFETSFNILLVCHITLLPKI